MGNGAAATDEWKRLDQAYDSIIRLLPVLINIDTEEYYSFKQHKEIDSVNHYIFYKIGYNVETNTILYTEADLNTQDGNVVLVTQQIPLNNTAISYQGGNGIEILDTADEKTKSIELTYGKTVDLGFEMPVAAKTFVLSSSMTTYYFNGSNPISKDTIFRIYLLDNNNNKILVEDSPIIYTDPQQTTGYVGVNINEVPYDSSNDSHIQNYTRKNPDYDISGILELYLDNGSLDSFYCTDGTNVEKNITLIVNRKAQKKQTFPEEMLSYGKIEDKLLDISGTTVEEITSKITNTSLYDYIPQLYYSSKEKDFNERDSLFTLQNPTWEENNTFCENFVYSQDTITAMGSDDENLFTAPLESGDNTVNEFFLNWLNNVYINIFPNSTAQYSKSLSFDSNSLLSLKYYRCNIATPLTEIITTKTWTVADDSKVDNALVILITYKSGAQCWIPVFKSEERHRLGLTIANIKRSVTQEQKIPLSFLPVYNGYINSSSYRDLKDLEELLTGNQIYSYVEGRLYSFSPSINLALQITDTGEDADKPVANHVLYTKFNEVQNSLDQKASSTELNNAITNLQVDYQTQVNNKPTIPTAASIQAAMAYDSVPTQDSENLVKSKDLYIVQQNLIEQIGGKTKGYVFDTNAELQAWLTVENKAKLKIGDVLYIKETGYPDYWWDGTNTQYLETQKVDLTDYAKTADVASTYLTKADAYNDYRTKNDHDFRTFIKKATISTDNNTTLTNTKNSCVEISLQYNESLSNFYSFDDREEYYCPTTILKVYQDSNLNIPYYTFSFNASKSLHSGYLTFLPSDAPEGTYHGSDSYLVTLPNGANNYEQFFLQAWVYVSTTAPKLYLKRTDFTPLT